MKTENSESQKTRDEYSAMAITSLVCAVFALGFYATSLFLKSQKLAIAVLLSFAILGFLAGFI